MLADGNAAKLAYKDGILFSPAGASITPVVTRIPERAVIRPTASTFVTSSYVRTPPTLTFPVNVPSTAVKFVIEILGEPDKPAAVPDVS